MGIMQVTRSIGDIEYKTMKEYYWHSEFKDDLISSVPDICKEHRMRGVFDGFEFIFRMSLLLWGVMDCLI